MSGGSAGQDSAEKKGGKVEMKKGGKNTGNTSRIVSTTEIETQKGMPVVCTLEQQQLGTRSRITTRSFRALTLRCSADKPVK